MLILSGRHLIMKLVFFALLVVGGYFLYQYTIGAIHNNYQHCWEQSQEKISEIKASTNNYCPLTATSYEEMFTCIENIQDLGNVESFVYQASPVRKRVDAAVIEHNLECSGYQVRPPKQKIFVRAISR